MIGGGVRRYNITITLKCGHEVKYTSGIDHLPDIDAAKVGCIACRKTVGIYDITWAPTPGGDADNFVARVRAHQRQIDQGT